MYLPAEKLQPTNVRVLVRIARQYRHLMADATTSDEKLRVSRIALDYAKRGAALAPNDSEAQLSVAISYGKMLSLMGNKEQIEASRQIKETADKAIKLDPRKDFAWHVLGRWPGSCPMSTYSNARSGRFSMVNCRKQQRKKR